VADDEHGPPVAVVTLERNVSCGDTSVEVRAATAILGQALRRETVLTLADRVSALGDGASRQTLRAPTCISWRCLYVSGGDRI
jgi:hypothetical protein